MARRVSPPPSRAVRARAKPKKAAARGRAAPAKPKKAAARKGAASAVVRKRAAPTAVRKRAAPAKAPAARATPRKAAARPKAAAPKRAPAKQASPKRAAVRKSAPARRKAAASPAIKVKAPPQRFTVNHLRDEDFLPDGLRPYARYRDLGIAAATGGLAQAHVIRMIPPVTEEVRQRHLHNVDLQLVYVLKGWMKNEFEGHGVQMMEQGSCWLQPPGIPHTVLDYSDDLEVLEIIIPAEFETEPAE